MEEKPDHIEHLDDRVDEILKLKEANMFAAEKAKLTVEEEVQDRGDGDYTILRKSEHHEPVAERALREYVKGAIQHLGLDAEELGIDPESDSIDELENYAQANFGINYDALRDVIRSAEEETPQEIINLGKRLVDRIEQQHVRGISNDLGLEEEHKEDVLTYAGEPLDEDLTDYFDPENMRIHHTVKVYHQAKKAAKQNRTIGREFLKRFEPYMLQDDVREAYDLD